MWSCQTEQRVDYLTQMISNILRLGTHRTIICGKKNEELWGTESIRCKLLLSKNIKCQTWNTLLRWTDTETVNSGKTIKYWGQSRERKEGTRKQAARTNVIYIKIAKEYFSSQMLIVTLNISEVYTQAERLRLCTLEKEARPKKNQVYVAYMKQFLCFLFLF